MANCTSTMEYAQQFWSLGNVITGFAIVQSLTFLSTIGTGSGLLAKAVMAHRYVAVSLSFIMASVYFLLLKGCSDAFWQLSGRHGLENMYLQRWDWARLIASVSLAIFCAAVSATVKPADPGHTKRDRSSE